jgi:hypothetical protein
MFNKDKVSKLIYVYQIIFVKNLKYLPFSYIWVVLLFFCRKSATFN